MTCSGELNELHRGDGATRSNPYDAHELCGHSDAENGSAKAIPGGEALL